MTITQALFLGLLQGFTEFLPVSSSGHLVLAQTFFKFSEPPIFFDVVVHVGTLVAVLIFFSNRLRHLNRHLVNLTIIGTLPAVIAGLLIKPFLDSIFSSLLVVSLGLFFTGLLLLSTRIFTKPPQQLKQLSPLNTFIIGVFQAIAILPGVSRSGSTVTASLQQGLSQQDAFFFSFLLAIPAILGALILQVADINTLQFNLMPTGLGFLSALISGLLALKLLSLIITHSKLHLFSLYCFGLSALIAVYLLV